jgi:hypothetical protein
MAYRGIGETKEIGDSLIRIPARIPDPENEQVPVFLM